MNTTEHEHLQREMMIAEGEFALDSRSARASHPGFPQERVVIHGYQMRPGLDDLRLAGGDPICAHCQRRGARYETERLCHPCKICWQRECLIQLHNSFSLWSAQVGLPGANCSHCNRWLAANFNVFARPTASAALRRWLLSEVEIGRMPMWAFKWLVERVLPTGAPETAARLQARLVGASDAMPPGDTNVLYTALLTFERLLNVVARQGTGVRYDSEQLLIYRNARVAITRISRALLAAS